MDKASRRLFTAKSLIRQAARLMLGNMVTVVLSSAGLILAFVACSAAVVAIWTQCSPDSSPGLIYLSPIIFVAILIVFVSMTQVRLYRFAALGSSDARFFLVDLFTKRTWRLLWVNVLLILQVIVLTMLILAPVAMIFAALAGGLDNLVHGQLGFVLTEALRPVMSLPATVLMAVRYTLSGPAASIQDRVSFEALSTAGAPYRKDLILVVLLLGGAPEAILAGHTFLQATNIGPEWIASRGVHVLLLLYLLLSYLVFIGACSLAYKALRQDVERETEAVLSRKAYPEACAAVSAASGPDVLGSSGTASPDSGNTAPASGDPETSGGKA